MVLYVVRHGETDWNKVKRVQGHTDIPLNEYGRHLARETAKGLKETRIDLAITRSSDPCERDCTDHSRNKADPSFGRPQDQRDRFWRV